MIYIGIDPGKSGAMAVLAEDIELVVPFDVQSYKNTLGNILGSKVFACIERVHAMPKQGTTSMFSFGENYGWIQGILWAHGIPYELVTPKVWKKEFGITSDKNTSIAVCQRLFPGVSLLPNEMSRKPNDGMAEAMLLAEYARRKYGEDKR